MAKEAKRRNWLGEMNQTWLVSLEEDVQDVVMMFLGVVGDIMF